MMSIKCNTIGTNSCLVDNLSVIEIKMPSSCNLELDLELNESFLYSMMSLNAFILYLY
jgi:hypothetical protein